MVIVSYSIVLHSGDICNTKYFFPGLYMTFNITRTSSSTHKCRQIRYSSFLAVGRRVIAPVSELTASLWRPNGQLIVTTMMLVIHKALVDTTATP